MTSDARGNMCVGYSTAGQTLGFFDGALFLIFGHGDVAGDDDGEDDPSN